MGVSVVQPSTRMARRGALESDLPTTACLAAIDLDNLFVGQGSDLEGVRGLLGNLARSVTRAEQPDSPSSLLDPTAAVALHQAFGDALQPRPGNLTELVHEASLITKKLEALLANRDALSPNDVRELRSFCLALSKRALAGERSPYDRHNHNPLRR
jgi:hypothetical protein